MRLVVRSWSPVKCAPEFNQDVIAIGSSDDNDVVISDVSVARHQCEIRRHARGMLIYDLQSSSGTSVNGKPITAPSPLRESDVIQIGQTLLGVGAVRQWTAPAPPQPTAVTSPPHRINWARVIVLGFGLVVITLFASLLVFLLTRTPELPGVVVSSLYPTFHYRTLLS